MPMTSAGTYARVLKAETNLSHAAGNYENKLATKLAKGIVGVFTLGIGYGIIRLVEHYCNVRPKVAEYCANAEGIHASLMAASALHKKSVECHLQSGGILRLEEIAAGPDGEPAVRISDNHHTEEVPGTFRELCLKLEQEFETAPALYALGEGYQTLADFSQLGIIKMAPVINGPDPQLYGESLYVNSMYDLHALLSQATAEGQTTVRITLREEAGDEFPLEFIEYPADEEGGQNMVLLTNEATQEDIIVEGCLVTLCEELETIFTVLEPNKAVKTLDERIADVARGAIASGVAADTRSVSSTTPLV
ncbi:hypothetical protein DUQ00_09240 [Salmonella bongori]|uniref:hypothetical protein n=1 Tax=Salmonella bongori TaxID=54736 RepID=UPI0009AABD28|nr:hypothetical protein [Salmonella bongori]EGE4654887.1 hypothetical protein [Salmonella bongori serovar 40:z35:- str. 95-0123]EGE4657244.1 hypothetical protein [Salmonella bongori serovar 48:i:- str. 94-0708]ECC8923125.1 hypothetical protein [Salmonella bongori]ECC9596512.1 hypothetical protein [Salmonella bongori]EDP8660518.1 hypothetical protein [Salmonella bongori]